MVCVLMLVSGCRTPPLESIDQTVADLAAHPFDVAPAPASKPVDATPPTGGAAGGRQGPPDAPRQAAGRDAEHRWAGLSAAVRQRHPGLFSQVQEPAPGQVKAPPLRLDHQDSRGGSGVGGAAGHTSPSETQRGQKRSIGSSRSCPRCPKSRCRCPAPTAARIRWRTSTGSRPPTIRNPPGGLRYRSGQGILKQSVTYPNPTIGFESGPNNNNTATGTKGFSSIK